MITYNTESLVAAVKRKTQLPANSEPTFSDQDIIDFANEELASGVVPQLLSVRENYFAITKQVTLNLGQSQYEIPYRAIGQQIIDVWFFGTDGTRRVLTMIDYSQAPIYFYQNNLNGNPQAFSIVGNNIEVYPTPSTTSGYLQITYSVSPGRLVLSTECAQVVAIDTTTGSITISPTPASLGFTAGVKVDFIRGESGYNVLGLDVPIVSATTNDIVVATSDVPSLLEVGDWVALKNTSPFPQIPAELHPILLQRTEIKLLEAMADPRLQTSQAKLEEIERKAYTMLADRAKDHSFKVINPWSPMRRQSWRWL